MKKIHIVTEEELNTAFKTFKETEADKISSEVAAKHRQILERMTREEQFKNALNFTGAAVEDLLEAYFKAGYKMGSLMMGSLIKR